MKYSTGRNLTPCAVSGDEYKKIELAKNNLTLATSIEETFDAILENYLELKIDLFKLNAETTVRHSLDPQKDRRLFNRRLANLLSICKAYEDQVCKTHDGNLTTYLTEIFNKESELVKKIEKYVEGQKKELEYKFIRELRNHIQHRGNIIHEIKYFSGWTDPNPKWDSDNPKEKPYNTLEYELIPNYFLARLESHEGFNKKLIKEIKKKYGNCSYPISQGFLQREPD